MKPVEQGFKPIFVTEFNNQFDVPQLLHATRSKDKAFKDAGTSGKVIECVEIAALRAEQDKVKELVEGLKKIDNTTDCEFTSELVDELLEKYGVLND